MPAFSLGMKRVFTVLPMVGVELFGISPENDLTSADKQETDSQIPGTGAGADLPLEQKNNREADGRQAIRVFLILLAVLWLSHTY